MTPRTKTLAATAAIAATAGFFAFVDLGDTYELFSVTLTPDTITTPGSIDCAMDFTGSPAVPAKVSCVTRSTTVDEWESCSSTTPVGFVFTCPLEFGATYIPTGAPYTDGPWTINHVSAFESDGTTRMIAYRDEMLADSQVVDFTLGSCTPDTCLSTGYECGTGHADGCGGAPFDCGTAGACDLGFTCSDAPNFTCVPDGVDPTGLLAQYDFDSDGCPSSVIDSSGNGFTGTCSGTAPVWTASGHNGGGYDFSQSEADFITLGDIDAQEPFTIALWFKSTGQQDGWDPMISKGNSANYSFESSSGGTPPGFYMNTAAWGWLDHPDAAATYTDGLWHHMAGTYNGSSQYLYIDCVPASQIISGAVTLTDKLTTLGANPDLPGAENWSGTLDEVRIYDRALSQAEVNILSEQPSCGAGGSGGTGGTGGTGGVGGAPPTELLSVDMTGAPAGASWTLSRAGVGDVATGTTDLTPTAYVYGDYTLTWEDTAFAWVPPAPENCTVSESNPCDFGPP